MTLRNLLEVGKIVFCLLYKLYLFVQVLNVWMMAKPYAAVIIDSSSIFSTLG